MLTDPIADMLTRIRNAFKTRKVTVSMPTSNLKVEICKILEAEGYISGYAVGGKKDKKSKVESPIKDLVITLKYDEDGMSAIRGLKKISKPGLKVYSEASKLPKVLNGLGIAIISTSKGLMTDHEARKNNIGGEVLCFVY